MTDVPIKIFKLIKQYGVYPLLLIGGLFLGKTLIENRPSFKVVEFVQFQDDLSDMLVCNFDRQQNEVSCMTIDKFAEDVLDRDF